MKNSLPRATAADMKEHRTRRQKLMESVKEEEEKDKFEKKS